MLPRRCVTSNGVRVRSRVYKQESERAWCVLPPDIGWRFTPKAKQVSWTEFLASLVAVLAHLRYVIMEHPPTVVGDKKTRKS